MARAGKWVVIAALCAAAVIVCHEAWVYVIHRDINGETLIRSCHRCGDTDVVGRLGHGGNVWECRGCGFKWVVPYSR